MNKNAKLYDVRWGGGYAYPDSKIVREEEISEENGWDTYNLEKIAELRVNQGVDCSDYGGEIYVKRVL